LFSAHNPKQVNNDRYFLTVNQSKGVTTMKSKTLTLVAAMALAANMGIAQAAELEKTAKMPEILGTMDESEITVMKSEEMENISGEAWYLFGWKISNKSKNVNIKIGPCAKCVIDFFRNL
jgi:hypothetical protein